MAQTRRSSSKALTHVVVKDFQTGITSQVDKVQVPLGSSIMARNVEWQREGGFYIRRGVGALTYGGSAADMPAIGKVPMRFFHYVRDPVATTEFVSQYLVACDDGTVMIGLDFGAGPAGQVQGTWSSLQVAGADLVTAGSPSFMAWDKNVYLSIGGQATTRLGHTMARWDGTVCTALGTAFVNDYAAPTNGNMPPARFLAAWAERMWLASEVLADNTLLGSSIRFSHPGRPEDWADQDQITVGQAGDVITAIAPMRDMLVVFKRSSCYALLGSGSTNFRVVELSGTIGCNGEWTRDNQGAIVFWDQTLGLCRFDGSKIDNLFAPLRHFLATGSASSISRCGGVVTDGEKIYVATDFNDPYGDAVPPPLAPLDLTAPELYGDAAHATGLNPGEATWQQLIDQSIKWSSMAAVRWLQVATTYYGAVWVYREGAGWTSYSFAHPDAVQITMLGQIRSRMTVSGTVLSNRRITYGFGSSTAPLYLSDRYDDGFDWFAVNSPHTPINAFYLTPWLHGGLPAQIKRWKAPRIIQEADVEGTLLIDVFYDFNYGFLRRTLKVGVPTPASAAAVDAYLVGKPGTIGRAKSVLLRIRAESAHHWGVSSITIPVHPKVMR